MDVHSLKNHHHQQQSAGSGFVPTQVNEAVDTVGEELNTSMVEDQRAGSPSMESVGTNADHELDEVSRVESRLSVSLTLAYV
jgi:hypothetical protein